MDNFRKVDFMGNIENLETQDLDFDDEVEEIEAEELDENVNTEEQGRTFFKVYNDNILEAIKKLTGPELKLMLVIGCLMCWDNKIAITKLVRQKIAKDLSTKEQVVKNLITSLCKKGFLKRVAPKIYYVNDAYFSKQAEPHIKAKRKAGRSL